MSRPTASHAPSEEVDVASYVKGVTFMTLSVLLSGVLGTLQETTYRKYGPVWKEGLFYTVRLLFQLLLRWRSHTHTACTSTPASFTGCPGYTTRLANAEKRTQAYTKFCPCGLSCSYFKCPHTGCLRFWREQTYIRTYHMFNHGISI